MALAALIGGGLGLAGSIGSSLIAKSSARTNMKAQYNYALKSARNMPSAQREGLEAAGYNPMLALTGGSATSFTPTAPAPVVPDFAGSARDGAELANLILTRQSLENDKIEAETNRSKVGLFTDVLGAIGGILGVGAAFRNSGAKNNGKMPYSHNKPDIPDIPLNLPHDDISHLAPLVKKFAPLIASVPFAMDIKPRIERQMQNEVKDSKKQWRGKQWRDFRGARLGNIHLRAPIF